MRVIEGNEEKQRVHCRGSPFCAVFEIDVRVLFTSELQISPGEFVEASDASAAAIPWMLESSVSIITTDIKHQLFTVIIEPSRRSLLPISHPLTIQRKLSDTVFTMSDLWYALSELLSICLSAWGASCFTELACLDPRSAGAT